MLWRVRPSFCIVVCAVLLGACEPTRDGEEAGNPVQVDLRVGQVLGGDGGENFAKADRVRQFIFPRDHGPHTDFRSEWWYVTANLMSASGEEFGMQFTLFRQALTPHSEGASRWRSGQIYMAHAALTDVSNAVHRHDQRLSRAHPEVAGVEVESRFRGFLEDWVLQGSVEDNVHLSLDVSSARDFGLQLEMQQTQPFLYQGDRGLSAKGPDQASYYYSLPDMAVTGQVTSGDTTHEVTGKAWLDREWSTSVLAEGVVGWDWFALHFDDGGEITLFQLRREDCRMDPYNQATRLSPDQVRKNYSAAEFELVPTRFWRDSNDTSWPVAWRLKMGDQTRERELQHELQIEALLDDQLMETGIRYWEGAVAVNLDGRRVGRGYMELTGYEGEATCAE